MGRDASHSLPISVKPNVAWPQVERCYGGTFVLFTSWKLHFPSLYVNSLVSCWIFLSSSLWKWGSGDGGLLALQVGWCILPRGRIDAEGSTPLTAQHRKQRQQKFISTRTRYSGYQKFQFYFGQNCFCRFGGSPPYCRMHCNISTWGCQPCKSYYDRSCLTG